jgi:hypothetical protein
VTYYRYYVNAYLAITSKQPEHDIHRQPIDKNAPNQALHSKAAIVSEHWTKLYGSILDSSIWSEDSDVRIVWITLLARKDAAGIVICTLPGLARAAVVPLEKAELAIQKFLAPDNYSRTKEDDGRRIEEVEGGWRILNHHLYRDKKASNGFRSGYKAAWQRKQRATLKAKKQSQK